MLKLNSRYFTNNRLLALCMKHDRRFLVNKSDNLIYILPGTNLEKIPFLGEYHRVFNLSCFNIPNLKQGSAKLRRPELKVDDATLFYTTELAVSFKNNARKLEIQNSILEKIFEIICSIYYKNPLLLLDIGCGTGISGESFIPNNCYLIGTDICMPMLSLAKNKEFLKNCNYLQLDNSDKFPFRANCFNVIISTSFLQWLLVRKDSKYILRGFYSCVSNVLKPNGHFVLQFYPRNISDVQLALEMCSGIFQGALFSCRPHPRRGRKLFMFLCKIT
ncbi:18S rRNA (guanine-N(7))-methyltransferase bud23-like [Argonauta hians]